MHKDPYLARSFTRAVASVVDLLVMVIIHHILLMQDASKSSDQIPKSLICIWIFMQCWHLLSIICSQIGLIATGFGLLLWHNVILSLKTEPVYKSSSPSVNVYDFFLGWFLHSISLKWMCAVWKSNLFYVCTCQWAIAMRVGIIILISLREGLDLLCHQVGKNVLTRWVLAPTKDIGKNPTLCIPDT